MLPQPVFQLGVGQVVSLHIHLHKLPVWDWSAHNINIMLSRAMFDIKAALISFVVAFLIPEFYFLKLKKSPFFILFFPCYVTPPGAVHDHCTLCSMKD